jgi:hypothetical protein
MRPSAVGLAAAAAATVVMLQGRASPLANSPPRPGRNRRRARPKSRQSAGPGGGPALRVPWRRVRWKEPPTRAAWRDFIRLGCRTKLPPRGALGAGADQAEVQLPPFRALSSSSSHPSSPHARLASERWNVASERWIPCRQLRVRSAAFPPLSSPSLTMPSHGQAVNALVYNPLDLIWLHDPAARSGFQRACRVRRPPQTVNTIGSAGSRYVTASSR